MSFRTRPLRAGLERRAGDLGDSMRFLGQVSDERLLDVRLCDLGLDTLG